MSAGQVSRCWPLLLGAIASAAVWATPAGRDDLFRSTLVVLPLAFGGAWSIERFLHERGLAPLHVRESAALVAALIAITIAALRAPSLGLAATDPLVAVSLLLVLAYWVARTLPRLRPLLGTNLPARPSAVFFFLPFLVYASIIPWTTQHRPPDGDEPYNLLIAHSLVFDRDVDLANNYANGDAHRFLDRDIGPQIGDPQGPAGQVYSRHNLLLPLALAIPYGIAGRGGALLAMAALTALLLWTTLRLARRYFPERPGEVLAGWSVLTFSPPLILYSSQIWVEVPAALLLIYGLDRIHAAIVLSPAKESRRAVFGLAAAILLLPLIKIRLMLLSASLLALFCWRAVEPVLRRRGGAATSSSDVDGTGSAPHDLRAPALTAIGLVVSLGLLATAILLHNQSQFGNPLKVHSIAELDLTTHPVERYLRGLSGLFFDGAFGLFACAPIWLIVLPAIVVLAKRRHSLLADAAFVTLPYLVFLAPRGEWYGGWSPPFRYGLAFLPLLGLALAQSFSERRRTTARLAIGGLGAATLVLTLLWVAAPGWTYNFANGSSRVLDHLGANLGVDVARVLPSYVRPRAASWGGPLAALFFLLCWRLSRQRTLRAPGPRTRERRVSAATVPRRATAAGTAALGAALLLLVVSGVVVAAAWVPTKTVEVEDAWAAKSGGELNPPMWTIDRWRYRGAWLIPEGDRIVVPVAPGGDRVTIELEARYLRRRHPPLTLRISRGEGATAREIATREFVEDSDWATIELGPFDWPDRSPIVLEAWGPDPPDDNLQRNRLIVDRLRFRWE